jgi:hypothetical protein
VRPEVVFAARWCHRQFLMSPINFAASDSYRWSVDVFHLHGMYRWTVIRHFQLCFEVWLWILPLKQTFVSPTAAMIPSLSFYYCTLCVLPRCTFWAIRRRDTFLLCRDTPVNVEAGNLHWRPQNEGFLGHNSPMGWGVSMRPPKCTSLAKPPRLIYKMWDSLLAL